MGQSLHYSLSQLFNNRSTLPLTHYLYITLHVPSIRKLIYCVVTQSSSVKQWHSINSMNVLPNRKWTTTGVNMGPLQHCCQTADPN